MAKQRVFCLIPIECNRRKHLSIKQPGLPTGRRLAIYRIIRLTRKTQIGRRPWNEIDRVFGLLRRGHFGRFFTRSADAQTVPCFDVEIAENRLRQDFGERVIGVGVPFTGDLMKLFVPPIGKNVPHRNHTI